MFERGCSHPIFGPLVLLAVLVLLAFVFLHFSHEVLDAGGLGAACLALAAALGLVVVQQRSASTAVDRSASRNRRGPPRPSARSASTVALAHSIRNLPLRR